MKPEQYLTIQGWMRTELNLRGNDLLVYAIIYGFSQDRTTTFTGSLQYLADWCGATKQGIQKNLKNLIERGLIKKTEVEKNGVKFCEYSCIVCNSVAHPVQLSCNNNIEDNKENYNVIVNNNTEDDRSDFEKHSYSPDELKADFLGSRKRITPTKKKSLYDKCVEEVYSFTKNLRVQDALLQYLSVRLAIKDKPIYGVGQWKGLLNRLNELSKKEHDQLAIIKRSTERGWCSFFPISGNNSVFSEGDGVTCESAEDTEDERRERLREQGRRSEF